MSDHPVLHTHRLLLEPLDLGHAIALHEAFRNEDAARYWHTPGHGTPADTVAMVTTLLSGPGQAWVLRPRETGEPIGLIYFLGNPEAPGLGYFLHPAHWRRGLMTEALEAVIAYGFDQRGYDRIELWIDAENVASRRLAEGRGFRIRSSFRQRQKGSIRTTLVYGLHLSDRSPGFRRARPEGLRLIPILPVPDVPATLAYYRDILGFRVDFTVGTPPVFGSVSLRDWMESGAQIRFKKSARSAAAKDLWFQIDMGPEIEALYEILLTQGVNIHSPLAETDLGDREFSITDLNGYVLYFGAVA